MRKSGLLFFIIFCSLISSFAQEGKVNLTGNVIDDETKIPVEQATVQLFSLPDSLFRLGTASTEKGHFVFRVNPDKYLLKVSFVGYAPLFKSLDIKAAKSPLHLGNLYLEPDAVLLEGTTITGQAAQVVVVKDTTIYNASAYRVPEGAVLEDLVKKLPGAQVDKDGKVTVNGKEIKRIMVDGKEFFTQDPKLALKNLPVNMIDKVKAYDKKSDLARVTGVEDGEEEAVLDLTVKKGMKQGWFGNFIGGYGNRQRYESGAMANRFTDNMQFSVVASANNTNNQGFSEFGDAGRGLGGSGGSGVNASKSIAANFSETFKKLQVGGDIQYGYSDREMWTKSSRETFLPDDVTSIRNERNNTRRKRKDLSANLRLEWNPDSLTNIIFRPSGSYSRTKSYDEGYSVTLDNLQDSVNKSLSDNDMRGRDVTVRGDLQINRKLGKPGRNITFRLNYNYNDGESDNYSYSETNFYKADSLSVLDRYINGTNKGNGYRLQLMYIEPVFTNRFLQFSYSYQYKYTHYQKYVYDKNYPYNESPVNRLDSISDETQNKYSIHEIDFSFRTVREKYMYNVGITLQPQKSVTATLLGANAKGSLSQTVINFSPNLNFRYRFTKEMQLQLMYRGNSNAPDVEDLQEIKDITDPMNLIYGNPALKPSFTNRFMLFYNYYRPRQQQNISLHFSFNNVLNSVTNKITYNETTGAKSTRSVNVNGNWGLNVFFSFNSPFRNKKFTANTYTNASYNKMVGFSSINRGDTRKSHTNRINIYERMKGNFRNDILEIGVWGGILYGRSANSIQKQNNQETFDYELGAETNITLPWNFYFSSDINYLIKVGYGEGFDKNVVLWNAQISKNFLSSKQLTLRFKIYDILRQQNSLTRTITANYTEDTEYNILKSYFMFHLVYRLNTLGGKQKRRSSMNRPAHRAGKSSGIIYR